MENGKIMFSILMNPFEALLCTLLIFGIVLASFALAYLFVWIEDKTSTKTALIISIVLSFIVIYLFFIFS